MKIKIFYLNADTTEEVIQTRINEWLKHRNDIITILHIFQSSENEDTIISIWYKENPHII